MSDTFGNMWRSIALNCPFVPIALAQQWINNRYRQAVDQTAWSGQVKNSQFIIPNEYVTGTMNVTNNSTNVTGNGTTWLTSAQAIAFPLTNQQLIATGTGPYYNIASVQSDTQLTLEIPYGGTTASAISYEIGQFYVTAPSDFLSFISIKDPVNNWRLRYNKSQEWLDRIDARRTTVGNAWIFVDYKQNSSGVPMYEVWPRVTSQRLYPFLYKRRPGDLVNDTDILMFPLRGDEIKKGALADLACWPGTESRKNPYFNLGLAEKFEADFQSYLNDLMRVDQDIYMTSLIDPYEGWNMLSDVPIDAAFLQSHDF